MSYKKGRRFENYIKDKLKREDFYVIRSAGSKGVFDLIAIKHDLTLGIQCKASEYVSKKEIEKIISTAVKYGITPVLAFKQKNRIVLIDLLTNEEI